MCLAVWATPLLSGVVLGTVVALFGILRYMCGIHTPLSDVTLLNWYVVITNELEPLQCDNWLIAHARQETTHPKG